jgi:hypothetical protein
MKASEFKAVIKQLVIEEVEREVQRQVSKQLPKLLFEMLRQKPQNINQILVKEDVASDPEDTPITKKMPLTINNNVIPEQKKIIKKYTKDPVLNAILNETVPGLPQTGNDVGVPLPNFSKIGVSEEFVDEMKEILNESSTTISADSETTEEPTGTDLSKLFNKNFKAILDQSKKRHGGNFSNVLQNW